MKNIYSGIKAGFIANEIYPVVSSYLHKRLEMIKNPAVMKFLNTQPQNVLDLLRWENKKFRKVNPKKDPIQKEFIPTTHPNIFLIKPRDSGGGRRGMTPMFYACPYCNGRLFWGMPVCGWCGKSVAENMEVGPGIQNALFSLLDYIYPQSNKPNISSILAALIKPGKTNDADEEINPLEFKQVLKDIDKFIPVSAYVKKEA